MNALLLIAVLPPVQLALQSVQVPAWVGGLLGLRLYKAYGEVVSLGTASVNVGAFNGFIFIKQRGKRADFVPYIISDINIVQLAGENIDYGYDLVKEDDAVIIRGNGSEPALYLSYRAFEIIL